VSWFASNGAQARSEIHLDNDGGMLTVPVTVNGVLVLNFVLDSGASDVSIPADMFSTLLRSGSIHKADLLDLQTYQLADGSTARAQRFRIRSLKVGGIEIRDIIGSVSKAGPLLLGQTFLKRFGSWSIDNQRQMLVLGGAARPAVETQIAAGASVPRFMQLAAMNGWVAYSSQEKGGMICFIVGQPVRSQPGDAKRNSVHLLVTHNTVDKTRNVVSFTAGYRYKFGTKAPLTIGDKTFDLFTKEDTAWARSAAADNDIVSAMLMTRQAIIRGEPSAGPATSDLYDLVGFDYVLNAIDDACGISR